MKKLILFSFGVVLAATVIPNFSVITHARSNTLPEGTLRYSGRDKLETFFIRLDVLGLTKESFKKVCKEQKVSPSEIKALCIDAIECSNVLVLKMYHDGTTQRSHHQGIEILGMYAAASCILQAIGFFKL